MNLGIGIDLGGTTIKAAAFNLDDGNTIAQKTTPTRDGEFVSDGIPAFALGISLLLDEFRAQFFTPFTAVGISAPGIASRDHSCIDFMPNRIHGIEGFDWRAYLGLSPDLPFTVLNDAHAALVGELWLGAAKGVDDVAMLTLGTGVGGAIISGGRLITGHGGRAGHIGHLSLDPDGAPDICNSPGSLEAAVGNYSITERSAGRFRSTYELVTALDTGDTQAEHIWENSINALGAGIVGIINSLDPELILLGGGVSKAGQHITRLLGPYLDKYEWRPGGRQTHIRFATLGEYAGAAGAVHFARTDRLTQS